MVAGGRKGFITYVAAGILLLVTILIFAYSSFIRGDIHFTFHVIDVQTADLIANSALSITLSRLVSMSPGQIDLTPGRTSRIDISKDPFIQNLMEHYGSGLGIKLSIESRLTVLTKEYFKNKEELQFVSLPDPEECHGLMLVEVSVVYKGIKRFVKDLREYRFVNVIPPVYSHFTLFVKNAANGGEDKFNVIKNDRDGNVIGEYRPLYLSNGDHMAFPLEKKGWIFLGGGKIILNLAQGYSESGESFHLIQDPTRIDFPSDEYLIVNRYVGYYDSLSSEQCIARACKKFCSSYLKLFGNEKDSTFTLVAGNVYRSYFKFSAIFKIIGGKIYDPLLIPYVPPEQGKELDRILLKDFTGEVKLALQFIKYEDFSRFMSQPLLNPYNNSFDMLADLTITGTPSVNPPHYLDTEPHYRNILGQAGTSYPNDGKNIPLDSLFRKRYFQGDLNRIDISEYLSVRTGILFKNQKEFKEYLKRAGNEIQGIIRIDSSLDLDGIEQIGGGGIIIVEKDINLSSLQADGPVTFISSGGNIHLSGPLEGVGLIALKGRIRSTSPLEIKGFAGMHEFSPEDAKQGGHIEYSTAFNPNDDAYRRNRRLCVSFISKRLITGFAGREVPE